MNMLVVPTNRLDRVEEFLDAWRPWPWDRILIVEDAPESSRPGGGNGDGEQVRWYSWRDIDASVPVPGIISRRDSAIRSFGFWQAWMLGAEVIFTLDDDCYPLDREYVPRHLRNLDSMPAWQSSVPQLRVRGLPYANAGSLRNICLSMGLWVGNPDLDAVQLLAQGTRGADAVLDRSLSTRVMPGEQYFPLCGMNLAFRREIACLMYFPPMGEGSPYSRFDDIWAGLVVQRICRHLRRGIVCGQPMVEHRRASDPFVNLVKEAPGIRANENMWETVDAVELRGSDPLTCMREMGAALGRDEKGGAYVQRWGNAITEWCRLFDSGDKRS